MADGVLINGAGTIAAVVTAFNGPPPAGQTFMQCSTTGLSAGMAAPAAIAPTIAPTDAAMARVTEDLVVALITKGTIAKADLPAAAVAHVNARRAIRGEGPL